MPNSPETHTLQLNALDQRVTKIEASVSHIESSVAKLARGFEEFQLSSKPNLSVLLTAAGFVLAAGGGLWALAIRPIEATTATLISKTADNGRRLEVVEQDQVRGAERSQVLRTQMESAEALSTQRDQFNWILFQLIYRKAYGEDLPPKEVWPRITGNGETALGYVAKNESLVGR